MKTESYKTRFILVILMGVALCFAATCLYASELEDRWIDLHREEIRAKQARLEEVMQHADIVQQQMIEERKYLQASQERIWKEFNQNIELERRNMQEQLQVLDDRHQVFEAELDKKRSQDALRLREKESAVQQLNLEMQRLRAEVEQDQQALAQRIQEFELARQRQLAESKTSLKKQTLQELEDGDVMLSRPLEASMRGEKGGFSLGSRQSEYYVEIGDVLGIEVWRVQDMTRSVTVRPDGRISLPLAGDIEVIGLNLIQIRDILVEKFSEYIVDPQVSISLAQFGGRKFILLGEIRAPGVYRFQQDISLIEGLALGGGFTEDAKSGQVMIIRGDIRKDPQVKLIQANMENLLKRGMLSENLTIRPNDIIFVGKSFLGDYRDVISGVIEPALNTGIDFFVLRDAIRRVQNKSN